MQELVVNRKFAEAADIQKEIEQLRAKCEATSSAVAALEHNTLIKSDGHYGCKGAGKVTVAKAQENHH